MKRRPECTSNAKGVAISCTIAAALIAAAVAAISLTGPPLSEPTPLGGPSFDYFGRQKATSAHYAEIDDRIAQEIRLSIEASRTPPSDDEAGSSDAPPLHISTNLYEFDLPEYWRDRVDVVYDSKDSVSIYAKGLPDVPIAAVTVNRSASAIETGSAESALVYSKSNKQGQRIELRMTNFVWLVFSETRTGAVEPEGWQAKLLDPALAKKMVSLQVLGKSTVSDIALSGQTDKRETEAFAGWNNAANAIIPTISVK